ncbi:MAG: VOC family protein [Polyangiaceae bacterium]|nr:VOC family protein [Polyangiaceae bacterium]
MKKELKQPWFCWFELRTREVHSSAEFYGRVVGLSLEQQHGKTLVRCGGQWVGEIGQLPVQAAQRGAPNHWLGHIGQVDLSALVNRFVDLGGAALGPTRSTGEGITVAGMRDPWGTPIAFSTRPWEDAPSPIVWAQLHTTNLAGAVQLYSTTLGWNLVREEHLGAPWGAAQLISPSGMNEARGMIAETATQPGVHPHWLYYFEVLDVERAAKQTLDAGGKVSGPIRAPWSNALMTACDDPFGAAFGLIQRGG